MPSLAEFTAYADARRHFSKDKLWTLFDGDRRNLYIGHECLNRHPRDAVAVRIAHSDGRDEAFTFG